MITLIINGVERATDLPEDMPALWYLRDELKLFGTKYGCGKGLCGACTILVNNSAIRSCITPISALKNQQITTIEGIDNASKNIKKVGSSVKDAWISNSVPQCGYCQPGQIMSALSLLLNNHQPSDNEIESSMSGNICRCGTYMRIKNAISDVTIQLGDE